MDGENCTSLKEFLLLGISSSPIIKVTLFTMFLVIYLIVLVANLRMIVLVRTEPQLHTPMYFFLSYLSFSDFCYSTAIGPRMLASFLIKNKSIPCYGCALQFLIFCTFADSECLLLAVMVYDRYMAISNPLLYTVKMSGNVCSLLMAGVYMVGIMDASINTILTFHLCFCGSNEINRFFCDVPPLLLLSFSDTQVNELVIFIIFGFTELNTLSGLFVSNCYIILAVIKIHSAEGRFKAFSTCTSHLTAAAIFQGTLLFMYFRPSASYSLDEDKMTSLFYILVIPMLNPLIYSLWNKDVKQALMKCENKKRFHRKFARIHFPPNVTQ
ncbi:olfactory receptor-like protein OLF2 [Bos indicus x Bos taurus]|uniref:olfactory receptor-like protein OLF2 n=1 Tax=Bos indicus x Bos taurus TaxID=30522 RepID=UPI000F7D460F|nr:olfactory receptor-like protein OLF2 [Bos indicus x Bos taurus]